MPRLKQRTEALRERGVATALTVLAEQGVAGLTARTVARRAHASVPAIYEVFGDKAGLIREVFFEGFRLLGVALSTIVSRGDEPLDTFLLVCHAFRRFVVTNPVLAQVMFSRPFVGFDPTTAVSDVGLDVSRIFVDQARAAVEAGRLAGDPTDIAHLFFAFTEGMATAESANRLGGSPRSVDRHWRIGLTALVQSLAPTTAPAQNRTCQDMGSSRRGEQ